VPGAELGVLDAARFIGCCGTVAGRPADARNGWGRARPFEIVLDNYRVQTRGQVQALQGTRQAAGIALRYLPAHRPQRSAILPIWNNLKQHDLPTRSFAGLGELKRAVDRALAQKAVA
jgi:hypothetical protein